MTLQLDNNLIAIRERNLLDIMDLALAVLRTQGMPLLAALLIGAAPMLLLNDLLLSEMLYDETRLDDEPPYGFLWLTALLVAMEIPLAAAPATLYLGQSMFREEASLRRAAGDFLASLPQLFWLQGAFRGLFFALWFFMIPPAIPFIAWPYLNEIILLERNPLLPKEAHMTTFRRSRMLHGGSTGDLLARWLGSLVVGGLLIVAIWMSLWVVLSQLAGGWISWYLACRIFLPIAIWIVVSFFTMVRFLSYLDLRIRSEGWEIELAMRAEAAQLAERPA